MVVLGKCRKYTLSPWASLLPLNLNPLHPFLTHYNKPPRPKTFPAQQTPLILNHGSNSQTHPFLLPPFIPWLNLHHQHHFSHTQPHLKSTPVSSPNPTNTFPKPYLTHGHPGNPKPHKTNLAPKLSIRLGWDSKQLGGGD